MKNGLNSKIKRLLSSHGIFLFGRSAFEIFMSVFIWQLTSNIKIVALFNIIYVLTHTLMFVVLAEPMRKGRLHLVRKIGLIGFIFTYFLLFLLKTEVVHYIYLFAFFIGVFNGMYWLPYHINRFDFTKLKNRGHYTGVERSIKTIVGLIAPITGGWIISSSIFNNGYAGLFLMGSVFFLISFLVGDVAIECKKTNQISWFKSVKYILSQPKIVKVFIAEMIGGFTINGSLIRTVLPLLILEKTGTEFQLGGWLSFFALVSILSSLLIGKKLNYRYYDESALVGGAVFVIAFILLFKFPILPIFILFGAIKELAISMIHIPKRVYSENLLYKIKDYQDNRIAYMITREIFNIGIGMTSSYIFLLFVSDFSLKNLTVYFVLIIAAIIVQVGMLASVKYSKVNFNHLTE